MLPTMTGVGVGVGVFVGVGVLVGGTGVFVGGTAVGGGSVGAGGEVGPTYSPVQARVTVLGLNEQLPVPPVKIQLQTFVPPYNPVSQEVPLTAQLAPDVSQLQVVVGGLPELVQLPPGTVQLQSSVMPEGQLQDWLAPYCPQYPKQPEHGETQVHPATSLPPVVPPKQFV